MAKGDIVKLCTRTKMRENFWAEDMGDGTFRVQNVVAFSYRYTLDDIVKATRNGYVQRVVQRVRQNVFFDFEGISREKARAFLDWLFERLPKDSGKWEGMMWPYMACAIPINEDVEAFGKSVNVFFMMWLAEHGS